MLLHVEDLRSGYGDIEVLRGVSFDVAAGEIVCLIGANGAGKSTLLKTLFGLVRPRHGRVVLAGEDIAGLHPTEILRRGLSLVPQGRCNFPAMTVRENLEMGAYTRRDPAVARDVEALMARFPVLGEKGHELAGNLSGGQQQVLEMAAALLRHPRLLLLDEPSLGLSPLMVADVFATIRQMNRDGATIIMVEQNARQALAISDHAVVLELGRKALEGTGEEIFNNPAVREHYLGQSVAGRPGDRPAR
jgi:branched-chain amino acid transport system ATP-binding protein